jgi:hypothetical protein
MYGPFFPILLAQKVGLPNVNIPEHKCQKLLKNVKNWKDFAQILHKW